MCEELFGDQLDEVVDIRGVHDWKKFMRKCRPNSADEDIQLQFSMQLRARADATIDVRSKSAINTRVAWSRWYQIMPYPGVPATVLPTGDQVPVLAPSKSWSDFQDKIVPCLQKFFSCTCTLLVLRGPHSFLLHLLINYTIHKSKTQIIQGSCCR